jgi:uncharacterized protein (DUF305 family)
MNKHVIVWLALSALSFAPIAMTSNSYAQMNMGSNPSMGMKSMTALEKLSGKKFDVAWLSQMIAHHQGALEMAQQCVKSCKEADVKKAAKIIIAAQSKEIAQMTNWLKSWYGATPDKAQMALMNADMKTMMDSSMAGMESMSGMQMSADKSFLEGMTPHHQGAVDMAKLALTKAARPELKKFAQQVINDQSKEIKQFQAWLKKL